MRGEEAAKQRGAGKEGRPGKETAGGRWADKEDAGRGAGAGCRGRGAGAGPYLQVGLAPLHAPHHDVGRGHAAAGREPEAHVAAGAHLQAESQGAAAAAPAQAVGGRAVQHRAVRVAPRRRLGGGGGGTQQPAQHQRPGAQPPHPPAAHRRPLVPLRVPRRACVRVRVCAEKGRGGRVPRSPRPRCGRHRAGRPRRGRFVRSPPRTGAGGRPPPGCSPHTPPTRSRPSGGRAGPSPRRAGSTCRALAAAAGAPRRGGRSWRERAKILLLTGEAERRRRMGLPRCSLWTPPTSSPPGPTGALTPVEEVGGRKPGGKRALCSSLPLLHSVRERARCRGRTAKQEVPRREELFLLRKWKTKAPSVICVETAPKPQLKTLPVSIDTPAPVPGAITTLAVRSPTQPAEKMQPLPLRAPPTPPPFR